jgi:uncharacterized SAM-binding protein YcdF (DUF218 family)
MRKRSEPNLLASQSGRGALGFSLGLLGSMILAAFFIIFGGFLEFVSNLPDESALDVQGDAIVVFTGGEDRIAVGLELLAQGRGKRLLISGVDAQTEREDIRELINPDHLDSFDCCVDLGWSAKDTIGNADETTSWINDNGFETVIIVTAFYHMPRALAEIGHANPRAVILSYPVFPDGVHARKWWRWPGSARLLASEYLKYVAAMARFRLNQDPS